MLLVDGAGSTGPALTAATPSRREASTKFLSLQQQQDETTLSREGVEQNETAIYTEHSSVLPLRRALCVRKHLMSAGRLLVTCCAWYFNNFHDSSPRRQKF